MSDIITQEWQIAVPGVSTMVLGQLQVVVAYGPIDLHRMAHILHMHPSGYKDSPFLCWYVIH